MIRHPELQMEIVQAEHHLIDAAHRKYVANARHRRGSFDEDDDQRACAGDADEPHDFVSPFEARQHQHGRPEAEGCLHLRLRTSVNGIDADKEIGAVYDSADRR